MHVGVTCRQPQVGAWANWLLAAHELYLRDPNADAFAIFQDDILLSANVQAYLERIEWPQAGYLNLYTSKHNRDVPNGWSRPHSASRGALALAFKREAMQTLLTLDATLSHRLTDDGHKRIDVAVQQALASAGIQEYVHSPSLAQHQISVNSDVPAGNSTLGHEYFAESLTFRGERFDCLTLLERADKAEPRPSVRLGASTGPRIGLCGFNTESGIGACNRDIVRHLGVSDWLIVPHPHFPPSLAPAGVTVHRCDGRHDSESLRRFASDLDALVFVETSSSASRR